MTARYQLYIQEELYYITTKAYLHIILYKGN